MKQIAAGTEGGDVAVKWSIPPPPPPPPPSFLKKSTVVVSVTNREIDKFWRRKRMDEEDHLLAAIKAAARIRARKLTDDDYKCFLESLNGDVDSEEEDPASKNSKVEESQKEICIGVKDWWTKSKYAYLNQPPIRVMDKPKRRGSTYIPNCCSYKPPPPPTASLGIF